MAPDDEIIFGHVADEIEGSFDRVERLAHQAESGEAPSDLAVALAVFELHGATLKALMRWYPEEPRIRAALADWELSTVQLSARGVPIAESLR
ncbi:MAG: hypothetical protein JO029_09265 [Candidatus Eremiobacteraeota bacterium]|nr:hypothetical protein [Candidatus Eremiobacteraeota bacterium]MBV8434458.1 hypothetical protein [Candidatus Eremiobacteraeota bacterium]MBV8654796.1 hypothetical protein [Candidatus Eremiobacteraeota bacterium]